MASNPPVVPGFAKPTTTSLQRYRPGFRGSLMIWWREIDRVFLVMVLAIMALGAMAVAAASPAATRHPSKVNLRMEDMHYFYQHIRFQFLGLLVMLGVSTVSREMARRIGIVITSVMLIALVLVLIPGIGSEVNGARRWLRLGITFEPSELLKPGFAICLAWILSWRTKDANLPVIQISIALIGLIAMLLMMQPDFGATVLFCGVWFVLVLLAGMDMRRIGVIIGAGAVGLVLIYFFYENGRNRIDAFFGGGTAYDQVDLAQRTLVAGGWTGSGLWLGTRKLALPEAHTDYIFSVIGEEFGLLVCGLVVMLYLGIVIRVLLRLAEEEDTFALLAAAGLAVQFGGQAFINIMVNLHLFPSKGMTLPLISYGGSSTLSICLGLGLLLAMTRRNPFISRSRFSLQDLESLK